MPWTRIAIFCSALTSLTAGTLLAVSDTDSGTSLPPLVAVKPASGCGRCNSVPAHISISPLTTCCAESACRTAAPGRAVVTSADPPTAEHFTCAAQPTCATVECCCAVELAAGCHASQDGNSAGDACRGGRCPLNVLSIDDCTAHTLPFAIDAILGQADGVWASVNLPSRREVAAWSASRETLPVVTPAQSIGRVRIADSAFPPEGPMFRHVNGLNIAAGWAMPFPPVPGMHAPPQAPIALMAHTQSAPPAGRWSRERGNWKVSVSIAGGRLEGTLHMPELDTPALRLSGPCSLSNDGLIYGVIDEITLDPKFKLDEHITSLSLIDQPFSIRIRQVDDAIIIKDVRCAGLTPTGDEAPGPLLQHVRTLLCGRYDHSK